MIYANTYLSANMLLYAILILSGCLKQAYYIFLILVKMA